MLGSVRCFGGVALALSLVSCSHDAVPAASADAPDPEPLPDITVTGLDGAQTSLAEVVKGKVGVVDLWATWCSACRPVSARAATLATAHASNADLIVVGLNVGEDPATVKAFLETRKPPHPVYLDPGLTITDTLGIKELPAIIVIDRQGRIVRVTHELDVKALGIIEEELAKPH